MSNVLSADVFSEVKAALAAERVLKHHLGPSRHHTWNCVFHEDKTPSLSAHGPAIRCFGCGWTGDIFRFVEDYLKIGRGEALRICADLAGIVLPDRTRRDKTGRRLRLPSLASSHALVLREIAAVEKDILVQAKKAAALAWRKAWDARKMDKVWEFVEIGAALDRLTEML